MDIALKNALAAKRQIEAEIKALTSRLTQIQAFISLYDEFAQGNTGAQAPTEPEAVPEAATPKRQSIPDAVAAILSDGYPRMTQVLLNMLDAQGNSVGGVNKVVNLSSSLSRDPRFENVRGKGWVLKSLQKPASPPPGETEEGLFEHL